MRKTQNIWPTRALTASRDKAAETVRITLSDHALQTTVWPKLQPTLRDYPDLPIVEAALSGYGIAYVPETIISSHVAKRRLTILLVEWSPRFSGYHLYYSSRRQMSPALAVTVDALRDRA